MDYELMWEELKFFIDAALEEGKQCKYDVDGSELFRGMYDAYGRINIKIETIEKEFKKREEKTD